MSKLIEAIGKALGVAVSDASCIDTVKQGQTLFNVYVSKVQSSASLCLTQYHKPLTSNTYVVTIGTNQVLCAATSKQDAINQWNNAKPGFVSYKPRKPMPVAIHKDTAGIRL